MSKIFINSCKRGQYYKVRDLLNFDIHYDNELAFRSACQSGNIDLVKLFLDKKYSINIHALNEDAFIKTCKYGYEEIARLLLDNNVNYHEQNDEALISSIINGNLSIVRLLLSGERLSTYNDNVLKSAFETSCKNGHSEIAYLLYKLCKFNTEFVYRLACLYGQFKIVSDLLINHKGIDMILGFNYACLGGNVLIVDLLLFNDTNGELSKYYISNDISYLEYERTTVCEKRDKCNPLILVCKSGNAYLLKKLLLNEYYVKFINANGDSAFRWACENGHVEIIKILLKPKYKVDVKAINYGFRYAVLNNHVDAIKYFLKTKNKEINNDKHYCLKLACSNQSVDVVRSILENKCDEKINVRYNNDEAFRNGCLNYDIVKILLKYDPSIDVCARHHEVFITLCHANNLLVIKYLLENRNDIDIHFQNEMAFFSACKCDSIDVIKYLLSLTKDKYINIFAARDWENDNIFIYCCKYRKYKVLKILLGLKNDRYIDVHDNNDKAFKIACQNNDYKLLKLLIVNRNYSLERIKSIKTFTPTVRKELLKFLLKDILKKRKSAHIYNEVTKIRRRVLRELKSLPSSHVNNNFPGGSDYVKLIKRNCNL